MNQTREVVRAWAHCRHGLCPGYLQEEVDAERVETAFTFKDNGGRGSVPGVERSFVELLWTDQEQAACPSCGTPRELTDQERPQYEASGYDPMGLVNSGAGGFNAQVQNSEADERMAAMEAQIAKLTAALEKNEKKAD